MLSEYTNKAMFKALFYCDTAISRVDKLGRNIIVGAVRVGTSNYNHHSSGRISKIYFYRNGIKYWLCNDSGLNTKAEANVNEVIFAYSNYLKLDGSVFSAYYLKTDSVKVSADIVTNNGLRRRLFTDNIVATNIPKRNIVDSIMWLIQSAGDANAGERMDLTITTTNGEGDYATACLNITCGGRLDDTRIWRKITSQAQNPSTGTEYAVIPTTEAVNYISNTLLVGESGNSDYYKVNFNATTGYGQTPVIKGGPGNAFSEAILSTPLSAGAYYAKIDGRDVILKVNNDGVVFGWCDSTYVPTPVNPLNDLLISIVANGSISGDSVEITHMTAELENTGLTDLDDVGISVIMTDGSTNVNVGSAVVSIDSNDSTVAIILDSNHDTPVRYRSLSIQPMATAILQITVNGTTHTRQIDDIEITL